MFKYFLILLLSVFLLFSCSKKNDLEISSDSIEIEEEKARAVYIEALEALKKGDSFYAGKKFKEVESLIPQGAWATKASLMASYSDYNRNAYSSAIFNHFR